MTRPEVTYREVIETLDDLGACEVPEPRHISESLADLLAGLERRAER